MRFEIKNRWSLKVQFECELEAKLETESYGVQLGTAIKAAYMSGANLRDANLRGADLRRADLRGADLRGADLRGADLRRADLRGADLRGADLRRADLRRADLRGADLSGADLRGADLRGADLRRADLSGADLSGADLRGADLSGADLRRADLRGADLRGADLRGFKTDFFDVLLRAPNEVEGLAQALREGRVDGSCYEGECACLVGTIANVRHCYYRDIPMLSPDSGRPAEQWFMSIGKGDTPESNSVVKITLEWIAEFQKLIECARKVA